MDEAELVGRVAVGVDGSEGGQKAAAWALEEARIRGVALDAVYAWQLASLAYSAPGFTPPTNEEIEGVGRALLDKTLADLPDRGDVKIRLRVSDGPPADVLGAVAAEPGVDLVVVGGRGHGAVKELLLGSVSHALSHHCPKPLVIVHLGHPVTDGETKPGSQLVVGVDGSAEANVALRWAAVEAQTRGVPLRVVSAWSASKALSRTSLPAAGSVESSLQAAAQQVVDTAVSSLDRSGLTVEGQVVEGHPAAALMEVADAAALLVVGSRGLGRAQERLLGSVSHACAQRSPVPVVIIPHLG